MICSFDYTSQEFYRDIKKYNLVLYCLDVDKDLERFDLACTYLKNDQNISAYNMFMDLAQKEIKRKASGQESILFLPPSAGQSREKDNKEEFDMAAKYYLKLAKKEGTDSPYAYQCAARCFLKSGQVDKAMKISKKAKKYVPKIVEEKKPDLSIILITADEKSDPKVRKTIGFGSTAFIQKPFTINELKNALDTIEQNKIR